MSKEDNTQSLTPQSTEATAISPPGRMRMFFDALRPFLRWLSHFLVNGFVAGFMLSLPAILVLFEQFADSVSRQVKADMAVRVVMELEVSPERSNQLATALKDLDKDNLVYQVITPQQGRALLGIKESWMNDLPPLVADRMPIVIELRQQPDRGIADLSKVASTARDLPEANAVLFNETAWNASRIVSSEIDKVADFPRYVLNRLIPLVIALTCLFSGIGLRHRRIWLMFLGVGTATWVCLLTIKLMLNWGIPKLAVAAQTSESLKGMIETSNMGVSWYYIIYLVGFWLIIEALRLRLRRN